jgi:hypothetical protein
MQFSQPDLTHLDAVVCEKQLVQPEFVVDANVATGPHVSPLDLTHLDSVLSEMQCSQPDRTHLDSVVCEMQCS